MAVDYLQKLIKENNRLHHNNEIHFLAREIEDWLPRGIRSIIDGSYTPRHLKRHYFPDEMVDQLHTSDRVLQHILLQQLKPTFKHVISPNCYHLLGPSAGVKLATERIRTVLKEENPQFVLRVDIRSYYKSIPLFKLLKDLNELYDDPKLLAMFKEIINNSIQTPRGYKNSVTGIPLHGPLSQFFSAIYLKKLDDAFLNCQATYIRYQDDIIILCKTQKQLNRYRRRMMEILHERGLSLSRKKSRMGRVSEGFHYLGVHYLPTQTVDKINTTPVNDVEIASPDTAHASSDQGGGKPISAHQALEPLRIVPHPRTLRRARENVKMMVADGVSHQKTRTYLHHSVVWWAKTSGIWTYEELLIEFINSCWKIEPAAIVAGLLQQRATTTISRTYSSLTDSLAAA